MALFISPMGNSVGEDEANEFHMGQSVMMSPIGGSAMWTTEQDYFDRLEEHQAAEKQGFGDGLDGVPPERTSHAYLEAWEEGREYGLQHNRHVPFDGHP